MSWRSVGWVYIPALAVRGRTYGVVDAAPGVAASSPAANRPATSVTAGSCPSLRALAEHFGVDADDIDLEPNRPPSLGEQLADALDS